MGGPEAGAGRPSGRSWASAVPGTGRAGPAVLPQLLCPPGGSLQDTRGPEHAAAAGPLRTSSLRPARAGSHCAHAPFKDSDTS